MKLAAKDEYIRWIKTFFEGNRGISWRSPIFSQIDSTKPPASNALNDAVSVSYYLTDELERKP
jgi:hypothetical protein